MILAANLTWLFTERPILERPAAAAAAGFEAVEVLFPYEVSAPALRAAVERAGLRVALINTPPGETMGCAARPGEETVFREGFSMAADYARELGCKAVHVMSGTTEAQGFREVLVGNLEWAAEAAPELMLTIEPLNGHDVPGYAVHDFLAAAGIVADVARPNVRLQFDAYHAARIHGDAVEVWRAVVQLVGHIQIAAAPDRSAPDGTTLDFLRVAKAAGYGGFVSAEYRPSGRTEDGLGWLGEARRIAGETS